MAEKYLHSQHFDYSGGVNQSVSRLLMEETENESNVLENVELEKIGSIKKVRGYPQRGSDVADGYNILGIVYGKKPSDGTQKQIVIADGAANSDAYTHNPITNVWTPHHLSLASGAKAEFQSFLDGFFMVNFNDATRWNDLTQWYTTTNVTNAPKARYIKLYLSRLYLAFCSYDGSTYPSRIVYSDLPSGGTITWNNADNYFDVDEEDGDVIKGLEVNANRLLIFKEGSLHRYDTNSRYQVPGCPGAVSQRSIKNIQGWTLYLHSSGIWGYDGNTSQLLSRKVKDIIEGIATKSLVNANAHVVGDHYFLYVGDIENTRTGLEIDNCLLDYDISKNAFTWRSLDKEPLVFERYPDDRSEVAYDEATASYSDADVTYSGIATTEERVFFGTTDGAVYQFNTGDNYDGGDIPVIIETRDYYLGYPAIYKLFQKVHVFVDSGKGVTVQYKLDDNDWKTLGRVDEAQSELIFPSAARGKRIRFRITESSQGDRFSFEGLDIYFMAENLIE